MSDLERAAFAVNDYLTVVLAELAAARERLDVWEGLCMTPGQVEELREREAKLREALRNWFEDVDEVMAEDLSFHALEQKLGAILLGYGGGFNHEDDLRAALADGEGET